MGTQNLPDPTKVPLLKEHEKVLNPNALSTYTEAEDTVDGIDDYSLRKVSQEEIDKMLQRNMKPTTSREMEEIKQPEAESKDRNNKTTTQNHPDTITGFHSKERPNPYAPYAYTEIEAIDGNL